jgi:hypothetical protein
MLFPRARYSGSQKLSPHKKAALWSCSSELHEVLFLDDRKIVTQEDNIDAKFSDNEDSV